MSAVQCSFCVAYLAGSINNSFSMLSIKCTSLTFQLEMNVVMQIPLLFDNLSHATTINLWMFFIALTYFHSCKVWGQQRRPPSAPFSVAHAHIKDVLVQLMMQFSGNYLMTCLLINEQVQKNDDSFMCSHIYDKGCTLVSLCWNPGLPGCNIHGTAMETFPHPPWECLI